MRKCRDPLVSTLLITAIFKFFIAQANTAIANTVLSVILPRFMKY